MTDPQVETGAERAGQPDPTGGVPVGSEWSSGGRLVLFVAWCASVAPFVAALVFVCSHHYVPTGDGASAVYRVEGLWSGDPPLVGAYSVHGWAHPGPALYLLAAPLHLLWRDPRAVLVSAGVVNVVAVCVAFRCLRAQRPSLALPLAVGLAFLARSIGPGRYADLWNPVVVLMPLAAWVLTVVLTVVPEWSGPAGTRRLGGWESGRGWRAVYALTAAVVICSAHVGIAALVVAATVVVVLVEVLSSAVSGGGRRPRRRGAPAQTQGGWVSQVGRWVVRAGAVLLVVASVGLPVVSELRGDGNLGRIVRFFTSDRESAGLGRAVGIASQHLSPVGPWVTTRMDFDGLSVGGWSRLWWASGVLAGVVVSMLYLRRSWVVRTPGDRLRGAGRGERSPNDGSGGGIGGLPAEARLVMCMTALVVVAPVLVASSAVPVFDYLVKWSTVLAALHWGAVVGGVLGLVGPALSARSGSGVGGRGRPGWFGFAGLALAALLVVPVGVDGVRRGFFDGAFPDGEAAVPVARLVDSAAAPLREAGPINVEIAGDGLGLYGAGVIYGLLERGVDVRTLNGREGWKWGRRVPRLAPDPAGVRSWVLLVDMPGSMNDLTTSCVAEPEAHGGERFVYDRLGAHRVAYDDLRFASLSRTLDPGERRRLTEWGRRSLRVVLARRSAGCGGGGA